MGFGLPYVTRQRDPEDERQVRVRLTQKGRGMREKTFCGLDPTIKAMGLAPRDFKRLQGELRDLRDNLLKAAAE